MSLESKIAKIRGDLVDCDRAWAEQEDAIKQQYNQAYGLYMGRKRTLEDVLNTLTEDEKNDESQEKIDEKQENTNVE